MWKFEWKFDLNSGWIKITVTVLAVVLLLLLPFLTGCTIPLVGKITFSWMQIFYGVLSMELSLAVYAWGVGNWSRFEPPKALSSPASQPAGGPPPPASAGPAAPAQTNVAAPAQPSGAPQTPQGGR